jgi:Tfp pilus assembly protein PilF
MATAPQTSKLEAALQQAVLHHRAGRVSEAERLYRRILRERPSHIGANTALGMALKDLGKLDEAAAVFRRVAAISPNDASSHNNLGSVLFSQRKLEEAEAAYRRALALKSDMANTLRNLALVLVDRGCIAESVPLFRRHAELSYPAPEHPPGSDAPPAAHKVRHDQEQREYLKINSAGAVTAFHLEEGSRVAGNAVNPDGSRGEVAARWQSNSPQIAVIDNLLTDEALDKLRQYCWGSTVWQRSYPSGYLGAMPEHGFACPLLMQIADELRSTYPEIIGENLLLRWWGFKYDTRLSAIKIHADFAQVNVNIWIAPDEANLDAESGGLIIWDTPAPLEWNFAQYNRADAEQNIRSFLAEAGAKSVNVPHRANRAVIFDSDLFHEGDQIAFKEGYLNRRINITMLYGTRESAAKQG